MSLSATVLTIACGAPNVVGNAASDLPRPAELSSHFPDRPSQNLVSNTSPDWSATLIGKRSALERVTLSTATTLNALITHSLKPFDEIRGVEPTVRDGNIQRWGPYGAGAGRSRATVATGHEGEAATRKFAFEVGSESNTWIPVTVGQVLLLDQGSRGEVLDSLESARSAGVDASEFEWVAKAALRPAPHRVP